MLFTSGIYFVFLIAVFFAYWLTPPKWRTALLVAVSYGFYAQAGWRAVLLLLAVSTASFFIARSLSRTERTRRRRGLLWVALLLNFGTLGWFKYAGFFVDSFAASLAAVGVRLPAAHVAVIAPLGLSFYVFQSAAYVIDVYRRAGEPAASYLEHLAFVSFFPTIVAGPITRAHQLLPQFRARLALSPEQGGQALFLIAVGLIKKIAIADYLRTNLVDRVFDFPERFSALEVLAAVYGYAAQIYADFSGYSDIAIGSALLGIALPVNFNAPYRAQNPPDFWRRWHVSLSTWLRDYVFFSLTKLRPRSQGMLYAGLILTMLVGGLWHGAAWTFVVWGLLHGFGLAVYRALEAAGKRRTFPTLPKAIGVLLTFHFVCLTWVFFRADSFSQARAVLRQIATGTRSLANLAWPVALLMALSFAAHWLPETWWEQAQQGFTRLPAPAQAAILAGLALGLYFVASSDVVPFIYARF